MFSLSRLIYIIFDLILYTTLSMYLGRDTFVYRLVGSLRSEVFLPLINFRRNFHQNLFILDPFPVRPFSIVLLVLSLHIYLYYNRLTVSNLLYHHESGPSLCHSVRKTCDNRPDVYPSVKTVLCNLLSDKGEDLYIKYWPLHTLRNISFNKECRINCLK